MSLSIGICGAGAFADAFIPLFQAHPGVGRVALAEYRPERLTSAATRFGIEETFPSFDALVQSDMDAVALFTQHHIHGPQAVAALRADKHVYSAVPMGIDLDEINEIVMLADRGDRVYMMGETSYYYATALLCRERYARGDFGRFVYGEGEYLHDMSHGLYDVYKRRHGADWQAMASIPPMFYPSHSFSLVLSVMDVEVTRICCLGATDNGDDGVFDRSVSSWDNSFSNETALCETSNGGVIRVNEMRRVGAPSAERLSIFGTEASFEEAGGRSFWMTRTGDVEDLTAYLTGGPAPELIRSDPTSDLQTGSLVAVHDHERLPKEFAGLPNGHHGSHQFLVDDFVRACLGEREAPIGARVAATYCAPGLVAHESARHRGQALDVPSCLGAGNTTSV